MATPSQQKIPSSSLALAYLPTELTSQSPTAMSVRNIPQSCRAQPPTAVSSTKTTIVLNGASITSLRGAAMDIDCGKRIALELKKGTVSTLVDAPDGKHKAALYCKGHLEIDKAGTLNVTGKTAHAISAKEYVQLKNSAGIINILGAKSDGIHCKQYFMAKGFTLNVSGIEGDGIQAEVEELAEGETYSEDYENGSVQILGGSISVTAAADGGVEGNSGDTYSSVCVKADRAVNIAGGTLFLANSGAMSKSVKAGNSDYEGTVTISGGDVTCHQRCKCHIQHCHQD